MLEPNLREFLFFRVGTVGLSEAYGHKPCSLLNALRHNLREIQAELGADSHIDAERSSLNRILAGHTTAAAVVDMTRSRMQGAGINVDAIRKDYVQAIELLFSLSAKTQLDVNQYFEHCLAWAASKFSEDNILSAVIHYDEAAPHCHILVLPLVGNKMVGGQPINKRQLPALRRDFAKRVATPAGLNMPATRLRGGARAKAERRIVHHIRRTDDPVVRSSFWPLIRQLIAGDPLVFLDALPV